MSGGVVSALDKGRVWVDPKLYHCGRKAGYPLKAMAERIAEEATVREGKLIVAYECQECGKFHIGHAKEEKQKEQHVSNKFFFSYQNVILARIKDDYNQYVFAVPPNTAENDQAVVERGFLIAVKKGNDIWREVGGTRCDFHKVFTHIFAFYPKEMIRFKERIEKHEEMMVPFDSIKMDLLNGVVTPSLTQRIEWNATPTPPDDPLTHKLIEEQKKVAEQEMHYGRAVFRNELGLKPHHRDIFTCCNPHCEEKIELRAYISTDVSGKLTSVGPRIAVDSKAIRKAGSSKQRPEWICSKCVAKMTAPPPAPAPAPAVEPTLEPAAEPAQERGVTVPEQKTLEMQQVSQFQYGGELAAHGLMSDLDMIVNDQSFDDKFVRGAMMMAFQLMKTA